jgi:hypothetical protein
VFDFANTADAAHGGCGGSSDTLLGAFALFVGVTQMARADIFYELGWVKSDLFTLNAEITQTSEGYRSAVHCRVFGNHLADQMSVEVDCKGKRLRDVARKSVRSDLSPVREVPVSSGWKQPNAKAIGGILINAMCGLPSPPARLKRSDTASPSDYIRQSADAALARRDPSSPAIVFDHTTVGDCIFAQMPKKVREEAILSLLPTQVQGFNEQVNELGAKCSSRPESRGDSPVIGAALSIFQRWAVMTHLGNPKKIAEDYMAAAWNTASAETRKPLLDTAAMLHDPGKTVADIEKTDPAPVRSSIDALMNAPVLKTRLDMLELNDQQKRALLSVYFNAVAMGEVAEAQLRRAR